MNMCTSSVLIDLNVWMDNYLGDRPSSDITHALFKQLVDADAAICYPITVPSTLYYLICAYVKESIRRQNDKLTEQGALVAQEQAWACINHMSEIGTAVGAEMADFWTARKLRSLHGDLEDNFVIAAAQRAKVDYLITNDKTLISKSPVPTLSPQDYLALMSDTTIG